ncbi:unnamed protein product [Camellia sinensis]
MACASSSMSTVVFDLPRTRRSSPIQTPRVWPSRFRRSAGQTGFFTKLGRLIKEKAKSVVDKLFSGFSKTRDNLAVIDELLLYWNLFDTDRVHDELEEALLVGDFGPKITIRIVESLWDDIYAGKLKLGSEIKDALKKFVLDLATKRGNKAELQLGFRRTLRAWEDELHLELISRLPQPLSINNNCMWKSAAPPKIKAFGWLVWWNRIASSDLLARRLIIPAINHCAFCGIDNESG